MDYHDRPRPDEYAAYYAGYVARVPAGDLITVLREQVEHTYTLLDGIPADLANYAYAPGKWTVKEVVGHLLDVERVMSYRALRIARGDGTALAGFDENAYVAAAGFGARPLGELLEAFRAVRQASVSLFAGLPPEAWTRCGVANEQPVSVRALACIIIGHEMHHRALLQERYRVGAPVG